MSTGQAYCPPSESYGVDAEPTLDWPSGATNHNATIVRFPECSVSFLNDGGAIFHTTENITHGQHRLGRAFTDPMKLCEAFAEFVEKAMEVR